MYFDVNIDGENPRFVMGWLEMSEYDGVCINRIVNFDELERYERRNYEFCTKKKIYERVEVRLDKKDVKLSAEKMFEADLFVVCVGSVDCFDVVINMCPDMVTFDYVNILYDFDAGKVFEMISRGVFFEVPVIGSLYRNDEKVMWMRNVKKLLDVTNGRNVVVSSGATCITEVKRPFDLLNILGGFGFDGGAGKKVLLNSARLVKCCYLRRNPLTRW